MIFKWNLVLEKDFIEYQTTIYAQEDPHRGVHDPKTNYIWQRSTFF